MTTLFAGTAAGDQAYLIGGGDNLQVNVWKNPELSQTVTVRPDGMITLPLIRDVPASGSTAMDLGKTIEERLSALVNAPNVTVTVVSASNFRVYTNGAVANGMYSLTAPINVLQLLARAGGPTAAADLSGSFILRGGKRIPVDLQPRSGAGPAAGFYPEMAPEDVLVVPFRDATRRVLVAGEVRAPSSLPFQEGLTVLDAFVAAGGGTEYADLDAVRVIRNGADGKQGEIEVNLSRMLKKGGLGKNLALLPGDIVVVPR
ncbi:MAG: polysaccharide biosynthesis/export family protein [Candidatus Methylomirabilia bacterium]